jgi:hypothetical protein
MGPTAAQAPGAEDAWKGQSVNDQRPTAQGAQRPELQTELSVQMPAGQGPMARHALRIVPAEPTSRELFARSQQLRFRLMQQIQRTLMLLEDPADMPEETESTGH